MKNRWVSWDQVFDLLRNRISILYSSHRNTNSIEKIVSNLLHHFYLSCIIRILDLVNIIQEDSSATFFFRLLQSPACTWSRGFDFRTSSDHVRAAYVTPSQQRNRGFRSYFACIASTEIYPAETTLRKRHRTHGKRR